MNRGIIILLLCTLRLYAAPSINTATNAWIVLPSGGTFAALATNSDGLAITSVWSTVSGPVSVVFSNANATVTDAFFPASGTYTNRITCSDHTGTSTVDCVSYVYASPLALRVLFSGTGSGTVNGQSNDYTARYTSTTAATLTAVASSGSTFVEWVGTGYTGTNNPCTVTVDSAKDISAVFETTNVSTVYYVATNGNNANPGTAVSPWLTIQYAVTNATAGSKVIVGSGEYNEYVIGRNNGTATNPIVFEGTRGSGGEWLTVIDPSTVVSNGWVAAPEVGDGVWKITNSIWAREMTIDGKRVPFVYSLGSVSAYSFYVGLTNGTQLLSAGSNDLVTAKSPASPLFTARFWDGVEALFANASNNVGVYTCYLRLRNGASPEGRNVRIAREQDNGYMNTTWPLNWSAVNVNDKSYLVFRNFLIRGAFGCIKIGTGSGNSNTVENCYLSGGYNRVYITGAVPGTRSTGNMVRNNEITSGFYGINNFGAWNSDYIGQLHEAGYLFSKYFMGQSSTFDEAIWLYYAGDSNVISGNHFFNGWGGSAMDIHNPAYPAMNGTEVKNNIFEHYNSTGLGLVAWQTNTMIHDNVINDCDSSFRGHYMDYPGETNRYVLIYRNTSRLPPGSGTHIFYNFQGGGVASYYPTFWFYHNSFMGGATGVDGGGQSVTNGGTTNCFYLDNLFSGVSDMFDFRTDAAGSNYVASWDYNIVPTTTPPAWFGSHNIQASSPEWTNEPIATFVLSSGSAAINAATNMPGYLPDTATKLGSAWDIGALEFTPPAARANSIHVINAFFK